jgi:hypothetical protein
MAKGQCEIEVSQEGAFINVEGNDVFVPSSADNYEILCTELKRVYSELNALVNALVEHAEFTEEMASLDQQQQTA